MLFSIVDIIDLLSRRERSKIEATLRRAQGAPQRLAVGAL
jgi:hypothetical protein